MQIELDLDDDENNDIYEENDFVMCRTPDGQIRSCGFSINSLLMREGKSPMMTINRTNNYTDDDDVIVIDGRDGRGDDSSEFNDYNKNKVSDLFKHLAVPAGFFYIQSKNYVTKNNYIDEEDDINEDVYDKLLELASTAISNPRKKKGTRKAILHNKSNNKSHRKHHSKHSS